MEELRVMVVDDEEIIRKKISAFLKENGCQVYEAARPSEAYRLMTDNDIDVVLLDVKLPESSGMDVLKTIKESSPKTEVIMMTGHGDTEMVVNAIKAGASDFFNKPVRLMEIKTSIEKTNRYIRLKERLDEVEKKYSLISKELVTDIGDIIGESSKMKELIELTLKAAESTDSSVLILGESGSGKELLARSIHYAGLRKNGSFHPVNCSAIPDTLVESEFFGHKKGAFTGALYDKEGAFQAANKGTLFLDEIGDMPENAQSKLLRVLEERKLRPVGGNKDIDVDVRVVSATNREISRVIEDGSFRKDLYYRLAALELKIPPLRERPEDVPLLIEHYVKVFANKMNKRISQVDDDVLQAAKRYPFYGNIRELKNMVERALILSDDARLKLKHFSALSEEAIAKEARPDLGASHQKGDVKPLDSIERNAIYRALEYFAFNKSKTAKALGISRPALDRKMEKHGISIESRLDAR